MAVVEAVRPFRGVEVRGVAELVEGNVISVRARSRAAISAWDGERFAADRRFRPGVLLRLVLDYPRL